MQNFNRYNQPMYGQPNYNQPNVLFAYVMGIEGAKAFFVQPNQTVILRDSQDNYLYEKTADMQGRITMRVYELHDVEQKPHVEYVTKKEFDELVSKLNLGARNE